MSFAVSPYCTNPVRLALLGCVMVIGCSSRPSGGNSIESAREVNLSELESASAGSDYFYYMGSRDQQAFFRIDGMGYYRLSADETPWGEYSTPDDIAIGDVQLFVTIKNGEITVPALGATDVRRQREEANWLWFVVAAGIVGVLAWLMMRPKYRVKIVVGPDGVQSHQGLAASQMVETLRFFKEEIDLEKSVTVYADRTPDRYLRVDIRGPIDAGTRQRIRNFLITQL